MGHVAFLVVAATIMADSAPGWIWRAQILDMKSKAVKNTFASSNTFDIKGVFDWTCELQVDAAETTTDRKGTKTSQTASLGCVQGTKDFVGANASISTDGDDDLPVLLIGQGKDHLLAIIINAQRMSQP